jgi:tetratricopeptide (TPR) repeat protein
MLSPYLRTSRRALLIVGISLSFQLFLPISTDAAQAGATESIGGRPTSGAIVVYIRTSAGEPLTTPALVRLYSSDGMPLGQASVGSGGQAIFRNVHPGDYSIEVEAAGYEKAQGRALLPMTGEADVDIYMQPESAKTDAVVLSDAGTPVLAPKARKELDAGQDALSRKDLKEARRHLEKAGELAPTNPGVLYLLGILYSRMEDLPRAEEFLNKATQMEPRQARSQAALGIILANEHKFDAALSPLEKALELDEKSWEARWALARCYYVQRKFQPALEQSQRALDDSKGQAPDIMLVVAASLTALGQYERSAGMLRKYLEQYPDRAGAARARRWLDRLQQSGKIKQN